ncbi:type I-F CRISPR-associated protein Csy2 [Shewanella algae]|uniref:type I-F CRISPR-associated protein Csy2 n=1 Tax=Shewanella algae TaxID=38313 RepID=UPI001C579E5C|nr:type I-F CRISPR-associated protein Csy2 [Shewanella algae]
MVEQANLQSLLNIADVENRNVALKRAFSAFTAYVDVTNDEVSALAVLLNITYPKKLVDDLLDKKLAKKTLGNDKHIDACISEVKWLHTHNLKYPDIRVSKQRLVVQQPPKHPTVLTSANCAKSFGWSHDAAKVNLAKLFTCHFKWEGGIYCLATILLQPPKQWKAAFQALGMPAAKFQNLCGRVIGFLPADDIPQIVDKYSAQVRMPYRDGYIALTPVASHALQAELQQAATNKLGRFTHIEFTRPAAVSELAASVGGRVKTLHYPPPILQKITGLTQFRLSMVQEGKPVIDHKRLSQSQFISALEGLLSLGSALALKQRRQQKVACYRRIRSTLTAWLAPLVEWRFDFQERGLSAHEQESIRGTIEYQFLTSTNDSITELLAPLLSLLNTVLSNSAVTQKYAFHQSLIPTLRSCLNWLLVSLSKESNTPETNSDSKPEQRYLYLKSIRVFDAQAQSNPYCVGVPSLTAVWGMMHNYQRRLNERLGSQLRLSSFAWFIRRYAAVSGKKLPELGMQGAKSDQFRRPGIIDNRYCDLEFDLVIHIDGDEKDIEQLDNRQDLVMSGFPANFAGGVMHPPEIKSAARWCELFHCEAALFTLLRRLPMSGKWIMPAEHSMGTLDDLLQLLNQNASLCPVMSGYALLDSPMPREGALAPLHSYAEPAVGIVECSSAIDIRLQGQSHFFRKAFWMLDVKENSIIMKRI